MSKTIGAMAPTISSVRERLLAGRYFPKLGLAKDRPFQQKVDAALFNDWREIWLDRN